MCLKCVGVNAGEQTARSVAQTFVEVGVEIIGNEAIFLHQVAGGLVNNELFGEAVAASGDVVGLGNVFEGNGLGAVGRANPVGVGQVDADGGCGIGVACQDCGGDNL